MARLEVHAAQQRAELGEADEPRVVLVHLLYIYIYIYIYNIKDLSWSISYIYIFNNI